MAAQIDRNQWAPFLDVLTKSLIGKQAEIEVVSLSLGDQIEAEWVPMIGITYDEGNRQIVKFKDPLALPAPAEDAPGMAAR